MLENKNQPHDKYFRSMMANIKNAKELFERRLPDHIKKIVDLNSLKPCKETYVDEEMKKHQVDTLYKVNFSGREGYIYLLLEHQSSVDKHMPVRVLKYLTKIMGDHLKNHSTLPVIYPMVIYHGKRSYNAPQKLLDFYADEDQELAKEMLINPCNIIDLTKVSDDELKRFINTGLMEYVLKNIYDPVRMLNGIKIEVRELDKVDAMNLKNLLLYVTLTIEGQEIVQKFISETFPEDEEERMASLAETWMRQGREEGRQEGIQKGRHEEQKIVAINMLREKLDKQLIAKVTGLSLSQIKALTRNI